MPSPVTIEFISYQGSAGVPALISETAGEVALFVTSPSARNPAALRAFHFNRSCSTLNVYPIPNELTEIREYDRLPQSHESKTQSSQKNAFVNFLPFFGLGG